MSVGSNLVDELWEDKPQIPQEKVWILDEQYTGQSTQDKLKEVGKKMVEDTNMMLLTTLDDIAWLLNLRGNDIEFNPLFFSYLLIHKDGEKFKLDLFISKGKVAEPEVAKYLEDNGVSVYEYSEVEDKIKEYSKLEKKGITVDKKQCS